MEADEQAIVIAKKWKVLHHESGEINNDVLEAIKEALQSKEERKVGIVKCRVCAKLTDYDLKNKVCDNCW